MKKVKNFDEFVNEAMVQVAGDKKPSGAQILAQVISEMLVEKGHIKPTPKGFSTMVQEIKEVIIKSTF